MNRHKAAAILNKLLERATSFRRLFQSVAVIVVIHDDNLILRELRPEATEVAAFAG